MLIQSRLWLRLLLCCLISPDRKHSNDSNYDSYSVTSERQRTLKADVKGNN